jgi:hypothetical protein
MYAHLLSWSLAFLPFRSFLAKAGIQKIGYALRNPKLKQNRARPFGRAPSFSEDAEDQKSMPPIPPPPGGIAGACCFFGTSATIASVVTRRPATEAAPCSA